MTVSYTLERFNYFNRSTTILQLNNNSLHQIFVNLYNLNLGIRSRLLTTRVTPTPFLVIYANFLLITNVGENKVIRLYNSRTRKAIKAFNYNQTHEGSSTLNLNRNSDVGNI